MTKEEYRVHVYNKYYDTTGCIIKSAEGKTSHAPGFLRPDECYEMINERVIRNHRNSYSSYNHHYRIKW